LSPGHEFHVTARREAYVVAPYVQGRFDRRSWGLFGRLGAGMAISKIEQVIHLVTTQVDCSQPFTYGWCVDRYSTENVQLDPAVTIAAGIEWHLTKRVSIGLGFREIALITREYVSTTNEGLVTESEDKLVVIHSFMPFGRLSLRF
jgi:hypothetical protein